MLSNKLSQKILQSFLLAFSLSTKGKLNSVKKIADQLLAAENPETFLEEVELAHAGLMTC